MIPEPVFCCHVFRQRTVLFCDKCSFLFSDTPRVYLHVVRWRTPPSGRIRANLSVCGNSQDILEGGIVSFPQNRPHPTHSCLTHPHPAPPTTPLPHPPHKYPTRHVPAPVPHSARGSPQASGPQYLPSPHPSPPGITPASPSPHHPCHSLGRSDEPNFVTALIVCAVITNGRHG